MAVRVRGIFSGLNSDEHPTKFSTGDADVATNVTVRNGKLQKRGGFAVAKTGFGGIKNMHVVRFASGAVYVVVKTTTGTLQSSLVTAGALGAVATIATEQTHNANDRGWFFYWGDRLHYFDRGGGSRWHPDNLSTNTKAWKAGLARSTTGPLLTQAAGGEKEGYYRAVVQLRNSVTEEEGDFSEPVATAVECRRETGDTKSGLAISNHVAIDDNADMVKYEWDQLHYGCTNGNTEHFEDGAGYEVFSHIYYDDAMVAIDAGSAALNKADEVHQLRDRFLNNGGEPPGSEIGMFTGSRAIYGRPYPIGDGTLNEDKVMYSLPRFPTMVPQRHTYTQGGDSKTVEPIPWTGEFIGGMDGGAIAMAHGGGVSVACGNSATYLIDTASDGQLFPSLLHAGVGAASESAIASTRHGVHVVGYGVWFIISSAGSVDIAENRFATTLLETPVAQRAKTVVANYSHRNQVWAAVVKSGASLAKRILVWDRSAGPGGALTVFDPAGLGSEGITAMAELSMLGAEPVMLIGTSGGRVLKYPSGTTDGGTSFAAEWRGYLGMERIAFDQHLETISLHCGSNVADNVKVELIATRTALEKDTDGSALPVRSHTLHKDDRVEKLGVTFDPSLHGNIIQVRIHSESSVTTQWTINDLVSTIARTDKK